MRGRGIHELLRDYQDTLGRYRELPKDLAEHLAEYERFVRGRGHILQGDPAQLFAQAAAQPGDSAVGREFRRLADQGRGPARPWFRLRNVPASDPQPNLLMTIEVGVGVNAVAWLTVENKPHALVGCFDGCLRVYDLATGHLREPVLRGHTRGVTALALSSDGRHALSGSDDETVRWWDVESGRCLRTLEGHTGVVNTLALSADGRHALSGSSDETVRWWDVESGCCLRTLEGHTYRVTAVALSADGRHALSGSQNGYLRWWDLESGRCLRVLEVNTHQVTTVALSADGRHALSGSSDKTVRWWDLESGRCLSHPGWERHISFADEVTHAIRVPPDPMGLERHASEVFAVALSVDGRHAVSGSEDGLRWWDVELGRCLHTKSGNANIRGLALSSDGRHALKRWSYGLSWRDLESGRDLGLEGHPGGVRTAALAVDGRHALSGSDDGTLRWWDLEESNRCLRTLEGHTGSVTAVALSSDGRHALSWSDDGRLVWWDLECDWGNPCLRTLEGQTANVRSLELSVDGRHALSGSRDGTLRWWDLEESNRCLRTLEGHTGSVTAVALSSDGRRALSGSWDKTLRWWDLESGRCLAVFTCSDHVTAVALAKQRLNRAVAADSEGGVRFFDIVEPGHV
jgi:WD40 repeat protein